MRTRTALYLIGIVACIVFFLHAAEGYDPNKEYAKLGLAALKAEQAATAADTQRAPQSPTFAGNLKFLDKQIAARGAQRALQKKCNKNGPKPSADKCKGGSWKCVKDGKGGANWDCLMNTKIVRENDGSGWKCPAGTRDTSRTWNDDGGSGQGDQCEVPKSKAQNDCTSAGGAWDDNNGVCTGGNKSKYGAGCSTDGTSDNDVSWTGSYCCQGKKSATHSVFMCDKRFGRARCCDGNPNSRGNCPGSGRTVDDGCK